MKRRRDMANGQPEQPPGIRPRDSEPSGEQERPTSVGRRRVSFRRERRKAGYTISLNLTPMVDTVFNLLFLFMIISRFGMIEGMLPARLPARTAAAAAVATDVPRTPIRVRLKNDAASPKGCRVTIDRFNEAPLAFDALANELQRIRDNVPGFDGQTPVFLVADDDVAWDHVVNAYNAAMVAQYGKIFFAGSS